MFGKPVRLTASAIAVLITAGIFAFLGVGPARATVANNGNDRAYTNVDGTGCQVVVGDQVYRPSSTGGWRRRRGRDRDHR